MWEITQHEEMKGSAFVDEVKASQFRRYVMQHPQTNLYPNYVQPIVKLQIFDFCLQELPADVVCGSFRFLDSTVQIFDI